MWYIFDQDGKCIATASEKPSLQDLQIRNEVAVFSKNTIPLEKARYDGKKVTEALS